MLITASPFIYRGSRHSVWKALNYQWVKAWLFRWLIHLRLFRWLPQRFGKIGGNLKFFWQSFWQFRTNYLFFLQKNFEFHQVWEQSDQKYSCKWDNIRAFFVYPLKCFVSYGNLSSLCYVYKATFENAPTLLIS